MKTKSNYMISVVKQVCGVFAAGVLLTSCSSNEEPVIVESSDVTVEISASQFEQSGFETTTLQMHSFESRTQVNGILEIPPQHQAHISTILGGSVRDMQVEDGQMVKRGDLLFRIESPQILSIQQEFLETGANLAFFKSDFERQKSLASQDATSEKTYLKAQSEYLSLDARHQSLKEQLKLLNLQPDQLTAENISSSVSIRSTVSGQVTGTAIGNGSYIHPGDPCMDIMDISKVQARLQVFERQLTEMNVGNPVRLSIEGNFAPLRATISAIDRNLNLATRTASIIARINHSGEEPLLAAGMYVEAEIINQSFDALALPEEAIVERDGIYIVLAKGPEKESIQFTEIEVIPGTHSNGYVEIKNAANLDPSTKFLAKGAFDLIAE